jgi:hypothetical protein
MESLSAETAAELEYVISARHCGAGSNFLTKLFAGAEGDGVELVELF